MSSRLQCALYTGLSDAIGTPTLFAVATGSPAAQIAAHPPQQSRPKPHAHNVPWKDTEPRANLRQMHRVGGLPCNDNGNPPKSEN